MSTENLDNVCRIRHLNDNFRTTFVGGQVVMTSGVADLPPDLQAQALLKVKTFTNFNSETDPYGEHDFGSFELEGVNYFFKLDYYAPGMEGGSEDAANPAKTARVLTIMRADEY